MLKNFELGWGSGSWTKFARYKSQFLLLREWRDTDVSPRRSKDALKEGKELMESVANVQLSFCRSASVMGLLKGLH